MEFTTMNIYQKINWVKNQVHFIRKANLNDKLGYNAVSSSMVLAPLSKALIEAGLVLISECEKLETIGFPVKTKFGESTHYKASVNMIYTWVNADKPEERIACPWKCDGVNTGASDKAVGAAYTYSEKYFMLKFFNIATDESDPDFRFDGNDDDKKPKQTQKAVQQEKPPEERIQCGNKLYDPKSLIDSKDIETQNQDDLDKEVSVIGTTADIYSSFARAFNAGKSSQSRMINLNTNYKAWLGKIKNGEKVTPTEVEKGLNYFVSKLVGN